MISEISCPRVQEIGRGFMENNELMHKIYMPDVKKVGSSFCVIIHKWKKLDFPNLIKIGSHFFASNEIIKDFIYQKFKEIRECFLQNNLYVEKIDLPEVT